MRLGRRALLAGLAGLAMPDPTAARLALRAAAAGARDRLATRRDALLGIIGDEVGGITLPGTALIMFRTLEGRRIQVAHNPSGRIWQYGELVEVIPLDDRAPLGYRVAGRPGHPFYAQLIWSPGTAFVNGQRVNEPWLINSATGAMTPIGTHVFAPFTPESVKTAQVALWQPLSIANGDERERYRVFDGRLHWRSRLFEISPISGKAVYPYLHYHPTTGWVREEPDLRAYYGADVSDGDNGRGEALDVDETGTAVFIDTAASVSTGLRDLKGVWRKPVGQPLTLWATQRWGSVYQATVPTTTAFIDNIDAGTAPNYVSSYGVSLPSPIGLPRYVNVFKSDRVVTTYDADGLASNLFYEAITPGDSNSFVTTWRADGGVYRLRIKFVSPSTESNRLYFGDGEDSWTLVNDYTDSEPTLGTMFALFGLAPYRSGLFGLRSRSGLSGTGNIFDAVNYDGPATLAGEDIRTIWHARIGATAVTRRAVVSVVTGAASAGTIQGFTVSNGKLYFSTGVSNVVYSNAYIDPGIYEVDPVTYGVRQVCGMPAGLAAGGWGVLWGDRRSEAA